VGSVPGAEDTRFARPQARSRPGRPLLLRLSYHAAMASSALSRWQSDRAKTIDELLSARATAGKEGAREKQLNLALVVRLAAEFQGFARELHDQASATFAAWGSAGNTHLADVLRERMREGRQLDHGNAQPGSLGSDFGRLGFQLWPALAKRNIASAAHQDTLDRLNRARNAIVHDNETDLETLEHEGYPITNTTLETWRSDLDSLAGTLDTEVAERLGTLFGQSAPW